MKQSHNQLTKEPIKKILKDKMSGRLLGLEFK